MTNSNDGKAGWSFDNSYSRLPESLFSRVKLTPVRSPELAILNKPLAESLGLNADVLLNEESLFVFAGNEVPEGAEPLAQAYAGHQFGHFTMLGDGRAVLIGEHITPNGDRVDIQLKGSGRTPYSRGGDGRAALGPMLREYIISEAMHALGIPTTRSLAVVTTGEVVMRETPLPGAILTRVAASHIRVGTFQFTANWRPVEELRFLADYTIKRHFPELEKSEHPYLALLQEVIKRQASLISKWQLIGFIHGVMNTDNMTLSGESIDYGPCAFMDTYDPETVFSSIDRHGRYAYGNQPIIGGWNLARLAEAILPLLHENEEDAVQIAQDEISKYMDMFKKHWLTGMRGKLGLFNEEIEDKAQIEKLLNLMKQHKADFTNTFKALTVNKTENSPLSSSPEFTQWHEWWKGRLKRQEESEERSYELMRTNNPAVIPRNHRVEEALEAAVDGDLSVMEGLLDVLSKPYAYTPEQEEYCNPPEPSNNPYQTFCGT